MPHRHAWIQHPGFPTQTLLLESHDAFLLQGEHFAERLERVVSGKGLTARQNLRFAARLEDEFRNWQWGMRCHEKYEETKLYPFLAQRFAADSTGLAADHERLHELGERCEQALASAARDLSAGSHRGFEEAKECLQTYRSTLARHLKDEEELVIPLLLSLSPEDFARYTGGQSCAAPPASAAR